MTISIHFSADMEAKLRARAAEVGKEISDLIVETVEEKLQAPRTFAEILAPVHAEFQARGLTEERMRPIFEGIREQIWNERHANRIPQP